MENLINELNINLDNPEFRLEDLSKTMNLSYSALYRKCHDITGKTLVEFVRTLKLKKAAYLIIKQGYNISEAAFNVGYKDAKYFTKCFKQEFKITPNNLKKDSKKNWSRSSPRKI
jgi:AraC-like DNA-binding protein